MKKVSNISKIDESRLAIVFKAYENKSLSLSEAADIAGISYKDFLDKMVENNIKVDFSSIGKDIDYFVKKNKIGFLFLIFFFVLSKIYSFLNYYLF